MGKYLILWKLNPQFIPVDPAERAAGWDLLIALVKQDMEKGLIKEWGAFVGEPNGFDIVEGSEEEVQLMMTKFVPYVDFEVHPLISLEKVEAVIKGMTG